MDFVLLDVYIKLMSLTLVLKLAVFCLFMFHFFTCAETGIKQLFPIYYLDILLNFLQICVIGHY